MTMAPLPTLAAIQLKDLYNTIEMLDKKLTIQGTSSTKIDNTRGKLNKRIDDTRDKPKNIFVAVPLITTGISALTVTLSIQKLDDVISCVKNATNLKENVKEEAKGYVDSIIEICEKNP